AKLVEASAVVPESLDEDDVLWGPEDDPACASLRDPALAPRSPDAGLWLFYTCEGPGPAAIRALPLESRIGLRVADGATPVTVVDPNLLGDFGQDGVSGPEPIIDFFTVGEGGDEREASVLRLWFLARSNVRGTSVGLAVGEAVADAPGGALPLPLLQPYPANPVLSADPQGDCPGCTLQGFGVTRDTDAARRNRLRFLVARRVPLAGGGRRYELVPFEQPWVLIER
ncbi:MAG: hypothetical protein AAF447_13655, partial [Myxococcota bacterium]